jgi:ATP-binding protein involved in chromosome partitioning
VFGHDGAKRITQELGVPFLGDVPLHMEICQRSDEGKPIVLQSQSPFHKAYMDIAEKVWQKLLPLAQKEGAK